MEKVSAPDCSLPSVHVASAPSGVSSRFSKLFRPTRAWQMLVVFSFQKSDGFLLRMHWSPDGVELPHVQSAWQNSSVAQQESPQQVVPAAQ
jgi:hypothetical protein